MLPDYWDILEAIDAEPLWYDGSGVPRYAPFIPSMLGVYDAFAVHARIACQGCRRPFEVARGWTSRWFAPGAEMGTSELVRPTLDELVRGFRYGDPPRHGCGGDSMQSVGLRILAAWSNSPGRDWLHHPEYAGLSILPEWVSEDDMEEIYDEG